MSRESVLQDCFTRVSQKECLRAFVIVTLSGLFAAYFPFFIDTPTNPPSELSQDARKCMGFLLPGYALPYDCPVKEGWLQHGFKHHQTVRKDLFTRLLSVN